MRWTNCNININFYFNILYRYDILTLLIIFTYLIKVYLFTYTSDNLLVMTHALISYLSDFTTSPYRDLYFL